MRICAELRSDDFSAVQLSVYIWDFEEIHDEICLLDLANIQRAGKPQKSSRHHRSHSEIWDRAMALIPQ